MNGSNCDTRPPLHIGASRIVDFPSGTSSAEFLIASTDLSVHFSLWCRLARSTKRFSNVLSSVVTLLYCSTCSSITDGRASPSTDALIDGVARSLGEAFDVASRAMMGYLDLHISTSFRLRGQLLSAYDSCISVSLCYLRIYLLSRYPKFTARLTVATLLHDLRLGVASRDHSESRTVGRRHQGRSFLMIRIFAVWSWIPFRSLDLLQSSVRPMASAVWG